MTPFDRALSIVTEYEAAGETSAARMLLLTRIEDLCRVEEETRAPAIDVGEVERLRALLRRYRTETPLGHQPHMIAAEVDEVLSSAKSREGA